MKTKITPANIHFSMVRASLLFGMLLLSLGSFSQTITNVSPNIITKGSVITLTGTGFTSALEIPAELSVSNSIGITKRDFIDENTMTFEISSASSDRSGFVIINGTTTTFKIKYIQPTSKTIGNTTNNLDGRITEIFTDWKQGEKGFWRSGTWTEGNQDSWPNDHHNLIGFTYKNRSTNIETTYSTGVADDTLAVHVANVVNQDYKAYSSDGLKGKTNNAHYLIYGDKIDGNTAVNEPSTITSPNITGATIFNSIIDGINGLDLGTGITNFNNDLSIRFYSNNGNVGALADDEPDLLITQIADADNSNSDIYYYADIDGNVVGRPISLNIRKDNNEIGIGQLAKWRTDLFNFDFGSSFANATPSRLATSQTKWKTLKMVALKLNEFSITAQNIDSINNVNMSAGGSADIAFLAYNKKAFALKSPNVVRYPVSQFICKFPNNSEILFNAIAEINGGPSENPIPETEILHYEWFKYNSPAIGVNSGTMADGNVGAPYILGEGVVPSDLGTYNLKIKNKWGAVLLPVIIAEGGTPTFWENGNWVLPPLYAAAGVNPTVGDRNLIFKENYSENVDLEGCNCRVPPGSEVVIKKGRTLKLYSEITVADAIVNVPDGEGEFINLAAGQFTLEDDASLIQTKTIGANQNFGSINVQREASNLHTNDYMYWSSPVTGFTLSGLTGNNGFRWETNTQNANNTAGNWVPYSGLMENGRGYIKRVPSSTTFTTSFSGLPNNGPYAINVYKSQTTNAPLPISVLDRNWNLVGNPYPSALNALKFLTANTTIAGEVNLWTHGTEISNNPGNNGYYQNYSYTYGNQYIQYNGTTSIPAGFNGNIGSGQSFFVKVRDNSSNTSVVNFNNAMRLNSSQDAYNNTQFYRNNLDAPIPSEETEQEKQILWLSLVNEFDVSSVTAVGYVEGATNGHDRLYDAASNNDVMSLFSILEDSKIVIQGRALPFLETDVVPMGFDIPTNGIYKIGIDNVSGSVFENDSQAIYLEDTYLNVIHDLRSAPYGFTATAGSITDRFLLRYTEETLSVNDITETETFVFIKNAQLHARSSDNIKSIQIYDLTGKQLTNYKVTNSNVFNASFEYARGVYLAMITMDNGLVISKKIMN